MEDAPKCAATRPDPSTALAIPASRLDTGSIELLSDLMTRSLNCSVLYERNKSHCVDINECRFGNGGCSQDCINTRGSFRCTCSDRYYLAEDGRACLERPTRCPALPPPDHGHADCIHNNSDPHAYQEDEPADEPAGRSSGDLAELGMVSGWSASRTYTSGSSITTTVTRTQQSGSLAGRTMFNAGSTCLVRCNKGYKLVGDSSFSCDRTGHWLGEPATCIRTVFIPNAIRRT